MKKENYVYMIQCSDSSLYTGWTTHLNRRIEAHNKGIASKYTRGRKPVKLVYFECCQSKSEALKREAAIKRLKKEEKLALIHAFDTEI